VGASNVPLKESGATSALGIPGSLLRSQRRGAACVTRPALMTYTGAL